MFARYAFPPNELGHCGPPGAEVLLVGGAVDQDSIELRRRAALFDGAWPYLQALAAGCGRDVLDAEVVRAYWLGNPLLDAVGPDALAEAVRQGFRGQPGVEERMLALHDESAGASHLFHVFVVYPWVGLLGSSSDVPRSVLDQCRVRWGRVESVEGEYVSVASAPLTWNGSELGLGADVTGSFRWLKDGMAFVREPRPGEQVSLHWDWVCDRISDTEVDELADRTRRQLASTNRWLSIKRLPV